MIIRRLTTGAAGLAVLASSSVMSTIAYAQQEKLVLEEVMVTARKREESLQNVPVAVTSLSKELERSTIQNLKDIEGIAPNLVVDSVMGVPGGAAISMRGVSYQETEQTLDPSIGIIQDGVYLGFNGGQVLDNFDIERMEILRGPQGTLFGKNTIGGVINVQRTKPTMEWGGKVSANVGRYGREEIKAVVNMPIVADTVGLKVFGSNLESDGYVKNVNLNEDVGGTDYMSYGFSVLGQFSESFDIQFTYEFTDDETDAGAWANFNDAGTAACFLPFLVDGDPSGCTPDASGPTRSTMNGRNWSDFETDSYTLTMNWDIAGGTLTAITGYRDLDQETNSEFDASAVEFNNVINFKQFEQLSQEIRFSAEVNENFNYVAGLYYWESELEQGYESYSFPFWLDQLIGLAAPGYQSFPNYGPTPRDAYAISDVSQDVESYAAFFQSDWNFATDWTLTIGARYTYEEKDFNAAQQRTVMPDGTIWTQTLTGGEQDLIINYPDKDDWSEFSPKIGIKYDLNDSSMAYASYAEGFKSGGFFGRNSDFSLDSKYDPEYVDTFELGYKATWMDGRAITNATLFYSEYSDKQEEVIKDVGNTSVVNAADVEMLGFEFEGEIQITSGWSARTSVGYLDAEYDAFDAELVQGGGEQDYSYLNLRNAPEWTFSAGTQYVMQVGNGDLAFNLNYRWTDDYDTILLNNEVGKQDSHETVDMSIDYDFNDRYRISVWGRNLTDEKTRRVVVISGIENFGQYSMGEDYGVEFVAKF